MVFQPGDAPPFYTIGTDKEPPPYDIRRLENDIERKARIRREKLAKKQNIIETCIEIEIEDILEKPKVYFKYCGRGVYALMVCEVQ